MPMREYLQRGLYQLGLTPPEGAIDQLMLYCERLLEQNKVMNLTAITEPHKVAELHFLDSAALLTHCNLKNASLIDVGTGAGFPGVVLKILEPTLKLTLLDSLQKRLLWLEGLCRELGLEGVTILHGRAEELSHQKAYRDQFDFATARAVAALPMLCELCLPYVKPGGAFLAMKTGHEEEEMKRALSLFPLLGGGSVEAVDYHLPESEVSRRLLHIQKERATPPDYPRKWAKIKKANI